MSEKILGLTELNDKLSELSINRKSIALCDGYFNILHIGHIRYLKQAKSISDIVIVSIFADANLDPQNKINEHYNEVDRAAALSELPYVDFVIVNPFASLIELARIIKPNTLVAGPETNRNGGKPYRLNENEKRELREIGIEVIETKEEEMASTAQINRYFSSLPLDIRSYLEQFQKRYSKSNLVSAVKAMKKMKVLVIGDTIIDEYHYCTAIGKSSKDPTLAIRYQSHDKFAGGVLAVANHLAGFSKQVDLITILGEKNSQEEFVRSKLLKNISPRFLIRPETTTLIKRRFIEGYSMNKLLEVYEMDDSCLDGKIDKKFNDLIFPNISEYDLTVVADFGHGTINQRLKNALSKLSPFLAVNAQSNAGNRGFNNISKYPKADYISMAEHEIRLEMRDLTGKIQPMMKKLLKRLNCRKIIVTRGRKGSMILDRDGEFYQVPSFACNVLDRVGAGDALFAITSLAAAMQLPAEEVAFIGNVVGAIAVEIMGNQKFIGADHVIEYINKSYQNTASVCSIAF